jgi:UDP-N-acetylmuramate dehydrogenase
VNFPPVKGNISLNRGLDELTWLRVGGPAQAFFQPLDKLDLKYFLSNYQSDQPIFPFGVGSNLIVRDGGINAVVIKLGGAPFNYIEKRGQFLACGAGALDSRVAIRAAELGLDLSFLRTIPGTIGGAISMNAGCYGSYINDVLVEITLVTRDGLEVRLDANDIEFGYRFSCLPEGAVIIEAVFDAPIQDVGYLKNKMKNQLETRNKTQPATERTAGSTFRNPSGFSSTGSPHDLNDMKAWKLIDEAGMRGFELGGAKISEKHSNFLINQRNATAFDLEELGNLVRKKVLQKSGIELQWEIIRVGINK